MRRKKRNEIDFPRLALGKSRARGVPVGGCRGRTHRPPSAQPFV